jgi:two-component system cell cycle response regulator
MSARVLIVDDIPANVKLLDARLTAEYLEVVTADNGAAAIEICERGHCDIVLLDVFRAWTADLPSAEGQSKTAYIPS